MTEYIRGWRQLKAWYWLLVMAKRRNWSGFKRELEIISGFAKPYKVLMFCAVCKNNFDPSLWDGTILKKSKGGNFVCPTCKQAMINGYKKPRRRRRKK